MSCTGILILGVFLPTAGATVAVLRGGWFGGVAGIMLGFGVSYAVVAGAWNPERATSRAPAPATAATDPARGPYDEILALCAPGWIIALLLGVAAGQVYQFGWLRSVSSRGGARRPGLPRGAAPGPRTSGTWRTAKDSRRKRT